MIAAQQLAKKTQESNCHFAVSALPLIKDASHNALDNGCPVCGHWVGELGSHEFMNETLQAFYERPSRERYLAARKRVIERADFDPADDRLRRLQLAMQHGDFHRAVSLTDRMMPTWALSPQVHALAAIAELECGEMDDAELSRFMHHACLEGLLATGDGTPQSPYVVTYASDEQELLQLLGLESLGQSLVETGEGCFDVHCLACGGEVWFNAGSLIARAPLAATSHAGGS